jgi:hypothetical protein
MGLWGLASETGPPGHATNEHRRKVSYMSPHGSRLAAAFAAVALISAVSAPAASAATASRARLAAPVISKISCSSSAVWLRLSGSSGNDCYTGNGTDAVHIPGVTGEKISGAHDVCLTFTAAGKVGHSCAVGPITLAISPAITVTSIVISTP